MRQVFQLWKTNGSNNVMLALAYPQQYLIELNYMLNLIAPAQAKHLNSMLVQILSVLWSNHLCQPKHMRMFVELHLFHRDCIGHFSSC